MLNKFLKNDIFKQDELLQREYYYNRISSLGKFYRLTTTFDDNQFRNEINDEKLKWIKYNKSKPWSHRYGLSLISLDGKTDGEIDLNSILEWNRTHNTNFNERSFQTPTPYWNHFQSISSQLSELQKHLGRSHLLRLDEAGIFPPHRDNYKQDDLTFRLLAFFNCSSSSLHLNIDGTNAHFSTNSLYFLDTRLIHSVVSFQSNAMLLILNVELNSQTVNYVIEHTVEK